MKKLLLLMILSLSVWGGIFDPAISSLKSPYKHILKSMYALNHDNYLWLGENNSNKIDTLLDMLSDSYFNYKHKNFNQNKINTLLKQLGSDIQPNGLREQLDVILSDAYLRLIRFVKIGDVDWGLVKRKMAHLKASQDVRATWEIYPKPIPSASQILNAINTNQIYPFVDRMISQPNRYKRLITILDKYRSMPKITKIPYGKILKPRSADSRIREIKKRLRFFGDFRSRDTGTGWSDNLTVAVRSFKERLNLPRGDYIDNKVILYLNKPKSFYITKIITNLDILKLYPRSFESEYIEVNIPDYHLRYRHNGKVLLKSPLVVGRIDRPTPIFNDKIEYMVLNPTWTITNNLIRRDLIPVLRDNPGYLKAHNIHVFQGGKQVPLNFAKLAKAEHGGAVPYRFVQYPGISNALGKVKFMFPNRYSVYLHDTDNHSLFKYRYRVFSSGCMRVAKPFDLMNILLRHAKGRYSKSKIQKIFDSNKPATIRISPSIPVHILYNTVYHENGKDYFLYDIYMYDQMIYESSEGHTKRTFTVPKKRLTGIKRVSRIRR